MTETEALARMVAPGTPRPGKFREGVCQIRLTRACNLACAHCTQGSQLAGKTDFMTPEQFEQAVLSLRGYFGVYGVFGGNPAISPFFEDCCAILRKHVPMDQCGLWCNDLLTAEKATAARFTFDPRVSNLNVHMGQEAYARFKRWWPEALPFGLAQDSRHSPPFVAMQDVIADEGERWELISGCDINQHWSAAVILFRGQLRAFFCELAASLASLHQDEPDYPDTGLDPTQTYDGKLWWQLPMDAFAEQVRTACHSCGIPLRGYGRLAVQEPDAPEQVSATHAAVYRLKKKRRPLELVTERSQIQEQRLARATDYLGNAKR